MSTQEHFYSKPGRLQGQHLTWIGEMGDDASVLPVDFKKETVRKAGYPHKTPKKGDEVRVHYTGSSKGSVFDTSRDGKPFAFTLGIGEVMEAWDRAVATMKAGELARFMVPEMYLAGGAPSVLAKIPDESVVTYEIELLGFTSVTDLFEDGGVVKTVEKDGEDYGKQPKAGEEVCMDFEVLVDGEMVDKRRLDYKIGLSRTEGLIPHKVLDKALLAMKRCEVVLLRCRSEYAFGDVGAPERGVPAGGPVRTFRPSCAENETPSAYVRNRLKISQLRATHTRDTAVFGTTPMVQMTNSTHMWPADCVWVAWCSRCQKFAVLTMRCGFASCQRRVLSFENTLLFMPAGFAAPQHG